MSKIKKILITGCGGMLGSAIFPYLKERSYDILATDIDLNDKWLQYLDVRDFEKSREIIKKFKPDLILHLAALTSLEYCEDNPKEAYKTNFIGTKNMAIIAKESNTPLIYISTAGVFDGNKERYYEFDYPNPINVYGKTKFYGEIAVENYLTKYFIVRAGWMVGGGKKDKKFVSYILSQIKEGKKEFNVVNDTFGTITYTKDFAKNLEVLFNSNFYGKYHMACKGDTNRVMVAKFILKTLNVGGGKVNEVSSEFFKKQFYVQRAKVERMVNANLEVKGINLMRNWEEALKDYLFDEWSELMKK